MKEIEPNGTTLQCMLSCRTSSTSTATIPLATGCGCHFSNERFEDWFYDWIDLREMGENMIVNQHKLALLHCQYTQLIMGLERFPLQPRFTNTLRIWWKKTPWKTSAKTRRSSSQWWIELLLLFAACCLLHFMDLEWFGWTWHFDIFWIEHDLVIRTAFHGVAPSCSSASVGFCPRDRMRGPSSRVEMQPGWDGENFFTEMFTIQKTIGHHHAIINGKIHYFYGPFSIAM